MTERKRLGLKPEATPRDPQRRPVRGHNALTPRARPQGAADAPRNRPPGSGPGPGPARSDQGPQRNRPPPAPAPFAGAPGAARPIAGTQNDTPPRGLMPHALKPTPAASIARRSTDTQTTAHPSVATRPQAPPPAAPGSVPTATDDNARGTRLSRVMSDRGLASRREADEWIGAGWVRVDGRVAILGQRIAGDERIEIDATAQREQARRVTILLNKPLGYVSGQAEDGHQPAAVLVTPDRRWSEDQGLPWHAGHARGLAPAGRLDIDSTGLLVLTQDGRVARHLIGEDSDVEKEYLVRVAPIAPRSFPEDGLARLQHGLELDGKRLRPARVSWANEDQLRFVLREGRKRQVRRMCEMVGLKVLALKRVRIGSVVLGKLPPGQWRYLRDDERF